MCVCVCCCLPARYNSGRASSSNGANAVESARLPHNNWTWENCREQKRAVWLDNWILHPARACDTVVFVKPCQTPCRNHSRKKTNNKNNPNHDDVLLQEHSQFQYHTHQPQHYSCCFFFLLKSLVGCELYNPPTAEGRLLHLSDSKAADQFRSDRAHTGAVKAQLWLWTMARAEEPQLQLFRFKRVVACTLGR